MHHDSIVDLDARTQEEIPKVANISIDNSEYINFNLEKRDLTLKQKEKLSVFLHQNKSVYLMLIGKSTTSQHYIDTSDEPPVRGANYRTSPAMKKEMCDK